MAAGTPPKQHTATFLSQAGHQGSLASAASCRWAGRRRRCPHPATLCSPGSGPCSSGRCFRCSRSSRRSRHSSSQWQDGSSRRIRHGSNWRISRCGLSRHSSRDGSSSLRSPQHWCSRHSSPCSPPHSLSCRSRHCHSNGCCQRRRCRRRLRCLQPQAAQRYCGAPSSIARWAVSS